MKYLLDTVVWIWSVTTPEKIGTEGLDILTRGDAEIYFSALSAWEVAIKTKLGKLDLPLLCTQYVPQRLAEQGIRSLPITPAHALKTYDLPLHHADPFDRLLIAQAETEGMAILTPDRIFGKYSTDIVWCGV